MTKNIENRECYKRVKIVKKRVKKKNRMWELKYKERDSMIGD